MKEYKILDFNLSDDVPSSKNGSNVYHGQIKAVKVLDYSDANVKISARFDDNEEINLYANEVFNFFEKKSKVTFFWKSQPLKTIRILISSTVDLNASIRPLEIKDELRGSRADTKFNVLKNIGVYNLTDFVNETDMSNLISSEIILKRIEEGQKFQYSFNKDFHFEYSSELKLGEKLVWDVSAVPHFRITAGGALSQAITLFEDNLKIRISDILNSYKNLIQVESLIDYYFYNYDEMKFSVRNNSSDPNFSGFWTEQVIHKWHDHAFTGWKHHAYNKDGGQMWMAQLQSWWWHEQIVSMGKNSSIGFQEKIESKTVEINEELSNILSSFNDLKIKIETETNISTSFIDGVISKFENIDKELVFIQSEPVKEWIEGMQVDVFMENRSSGQRKYAYTTHETKNFGGSIGWFSKVEHDKSKMSFQFGENNILNAIASTQDSFQTLTNAQFIDNYEQVLNDFLSDAETYFNHVKENESTNAVVVTNSKFKV